MNGNSKKLEGQVVTSAGNSWIVLPSQSRPGRIYYFNTVTGESAWNLSDVDIEKARSTSKGLPKQNHFEPKEPEEPPTNEAIMEPSREMPCNSSQTRNEVSSKIYNKQIINNRFPRTQMPFSPYVISPCNQVVPSVLNGLVPIGVNPSLNLNPFNNGVWAVPPPQLLLAPTVPPQLNHAQTFNNQHQFINNQLNQEQSRNSQECFLNVHGTSTSLSGRFTINNQQYDNKAFKKKQYQSHRKFSTPNRGRFGQNNYEKKFKKNITNDLRSYLTAKKLQSQKSYQQNSEDTASGSCANTEENEETLNYESNKTLDNTEQVKNKEDYSEADWLEEHVLVVDKRLQLDVTKLIKLAGPTMIKNCWYIVTDDDVLLNHLHFLNTLSNSDEYCRLMVPMQVMARLRELAGSAEETRVRNRARRALAFVRELLESGYLVTGEGVCDPKNSKSHYLLDCSEDLFQQNYHVILLSNNKDLQIHKMSTKVPMFTIKEMKEFLTNPLPQKEPKIPEVTRPLHRPIKITVSNDHTEANAAVKVKDIETQVDTETEPQEIHKMAIEQTHKVLVKSSIDACIQTDPPKVTVPPVTTKRSVHTITSRANSPVHSMEKPPETSTSQIQPASSQKRREIRLNRTTSNKTTTSEDSGLEKKQFRWRKKRSVSAKPSFDIGQGMRESVSTQTQSDYKILHHEHNESFSNYVFNEENISETSSVNVSKNATNERIIIDETSTSGIVSNSASNVDSESERKLCACKQILRKEACIETNMYAVTDQNMEDYLRLRCDEWILRLRQIMEDLLRQVVQQDQRFLQNVAYKLYSSGPWSIVESTDCVIRKFNTNRHVIDAANKWKQFYLTLSDDAGKINTSLPPSDYMELYSNAVSLVVELQNALPSCEDLQTAAHSLKQLLNDIQNPNMDVSHNETLEHLQELSMNRHEDTDPKECVIVEETKKAEENASTPKPPTPVVSKHSTPRKTPSQSPQKRIGYSLRSRDKSLSQSPKTNAVPKDNEEKNSFFSSLHLVNKVTQEKLEIPKTPQKETKENQGTKTTASTPSKTALSNSEVSNSSTPKIVRTFTLFPEYESKLISVARKPLDLDALNYYSEEELDDPHNGELYGENTEIAPINNPHKVAEHEFENEEIFKKTSEAVFKSACEEKSTELETASSDSYKVNVILTRLVREISKNLSDVHVFCIGACERLNDPTYLSINKTEMYNKARKIQGVLGNMCESLNGIYRREMCDPENNMQALLMAAGVAELDASQLQDYRDVIGQYLKQAEKLEQSLSLIINVLSI